MAQAIRVPATEFARKFTTFREQVQTAGVIEITAHDRTIGAFLSVAELERYQQMKKREREVVLLSEFDDEMLAQLKSSQWGVVSE